MVLVMTAASIGCLHTLLGPDHYLPFIVMAKARSWSLPKAIAVTGYCGLGHFASSLILGAVGIGLGLAAGNLEIVEALRGDFAAWALIAFGVTYFAWGIKQALKNKPHTHMHCHEGGLMHKHEHSHHQSHAHIHDRHSGVGLTPLALFIVFVLGPCEPLIPILMYPAATANWGGVILVCGVFGLATLLTMTTMVAVGVLGLRRISLGPMDRFSHALAGGAVALSGGVIVLLGV